MNITEAVPKLPGCQAASRLSRVTEPTEERSNIAICTQKVSWLESASWTRPTGGRGARGGLAFVPSQSVPHAHQSANPAPAIGAPTPTGLVDPRREWQELSRPCLLTWTRAPGCDPSRRGKLLLELPASTWEEAAWAGATGYLHALVHSPLHQDNIVIASSRAAKCTRRVPNLPRPLNHVASETPPRQWHRHGQSHDSDAAPEHCPR